MALAPHKDDPKWKDHDAARTKRLAEEAKKQKESEKKDK